jgi:hypothetical protein
VFLREAHIQAREHGEEYLSHIRPYVDSFKQYFTEGHISTFRTMRQLSHRATTIVMSSPPDPRIFWTNEGEDTAMEYKGTPFSFDNLRTIVHNNQDAMLQLFRTLQIDKRLYVPHGKLYDDPVNTEVGYNFMLDGRNRKVFEHKHVLLQHVLETPELRDQFVQIGPDGTQRWIHQRMMQWLTAYAEFSKQIMVAVEINNSGPARGTEVTPMLLVNTRTAPRNVYILGQNLVLRRRYHKTQARTGLDKFIPEPLDAFTSELVIQDMALLRPFASFLANKMWPDNAKVAHQYNCALFVNRQQPVTTEDITATLKNHTSQVVKKELGINAMRHIIIGFKRKRCPDLLELHKNHETLDAMQAGHSHNVEALYSISENVWSGVQEDILPRFIKRSMEWQASLHIVPGNCKVL